MEYPTEIDCCDNEMKDKQKPRTFIIDDDSKELLVDNEASRCISSHIEDFIDTPKPVDRAILGIGGVVKGNMEETVEWQIEDDDGKAH